MDFPSSPPLLAEDPPSSPPLLPTAASLFFPGAPSRKRPLSDYGSLSSDPIFSEDASEAELGIDDLVLPKRKRLVKGPWWKPTSENLRKNIAKKEPHRKRNMDSGVWMGSDETDADSSSSSQLSSEPLPGCDEDMEEAPRPVDIPVKNAEDYASKVIDGCLENGKEIIDLSGIGLASISSATLRPLHTFVRQSHIDLTHPPSEDEFVPLTPSLQLYLSTNSLTSLPTELFRLENITVLSLRNNALTELPASVCRLEKLKELNIAGNQLRYVPWEALHMLEDPEKHITLRPNPFYQLPSQPHDLWMEDNARDGKLACLATSRPYLFDVDGLPLRSMSRKVEEISYAPVFDDKMATQSPSSHAAPSLFELCLRSAQDRFLLSDVRAALPDAPPRVTVALDRVARGNELGNEHCSTCGKEFIVARAEWMEYWSVGADRRRMTHDNVLPVLRKTCSWSCARVSQRGATLA